MTHIFHPTMLREYDIRGVVGDTLSDKDAYAIGRSFATLVARAGGKRVAVGYDGRLSSPMLCDALIEGVNAAGIDALNVGLGPTPMLYYAASTQEVDGGIQITGSHQRIGEMAAAGDWEVGEGATQSIDIIDAYVDRLVEGFAGGAFRIGWDAGNGAAGTVIEKLTAKLPGEHFLLFTDIDGHFPNHHPDPTEEKNLADLRQLVAERSLDFGVAFDGDGDRIGAIDGEGRVIWGDQLLQIYAAALLADVPGATIIADVKASQALFDRVSELGGQPLMWKTGHSLIKAKMKETGSPLAGEMSGHVFFADRYYGYDDAPYAAVRLIEAATKLEQSVTELRGAMAPMVNTPELRFQVDEVRKFAIVDEVLARLTASGAKVDRTDGARVLTDDGWWLLRASNTQDVLVARAEAKDEAALARLLAAIDEQLALSGVVRGPQAGH